MGFDADDSDEFDQAIAIYNDKDLVTTKKRKIGEYICQMHHSLTGQEYDDCTKEANSLDQEELFLQ